MGNQMRIPYFKDNIFFRKKNTDRRKWSIFYKKSFGSSTLGGTRPGEISSRKRKYAEKHYL